MLAQKLEHLFSRGAARATLVDRDTRAAVGNVERLGLSERVELVRAEVSRWLEKREGGEEKPIFDLVFIDAPYRLADRVGQELDSQLPGLLGEGGRAIVESGARRPLRIDSLLRLRQRRYGAADVSIYGSGESSSASSSASSTTRCARTRRSSRLRSARG